MVLFRIMQCGTVVHQDDFWEWSDDFYDEFEVPYAIIQYLEAPLIDEIEKLTKGK